MAYAPIVFPSSGTGEGSLGRLYDCISCGVVEALDGKTYDLTLEYETFGANYSLLAHDRLIAVPVSPGSRAVDYFRVYFLEDNTASGQTTVYARQDSLYRLQHVIVEAFEMTGTPTEIWNHIQDIAHGNGHLDLTFSSDITADVTVSFEVPCSLYEVLLGDDGVRAKSGGYVRFSGNTITLSATSGSDKGHVVRRGKNATKITRTVDGTELVTAAVPYWRGTKDSETVIVYGGDVFVKSGTAYARVIALDVTADIAKPEGAESGWTPTQADVSSAGSAYAAENMTGKVSAAVSAEIVSGADEQTNLGLGDTVLIQHSGLGINKKSVVVETSYDVLANRYDAISVDAVRTGISGAISKVSGGNKGAGINGNDGSDATVTKDSIISALGFSPVNPADYIVDTGTSGIYTYVKYASGVMRIWGTYAISSKACTTTLGALYRTSTITPSDYPVAFADEPVVTMDWQSTIDGAGAFVWRHDKVRTARPPSIYLCRPATSDGLTGYIHITAVGRWK